MKISELEGARNLVGIECSCGGIWIRYGNKALDKRERQWFIAKHWEHDLKIAFSLNRQGKIDFQCTDKVT